MKPKKFKKLALHKETVARLNSLEQQMAKGGTVVTFTCFITIAKPYTCLCSYNTEPPPCCDNFEDPGTADC